MFEFSSAPVIKVIRTLISYLKFITKNCTKSLLKIIKIMGQYNGSILQPLLGKTLQGKKCDICCHEIKTSTSTMRYYLIKVHLPAPEDQSEEPPAKKFKQSTITAFAKKQSVEELMAEMTAKDGFTFHATANSLFIRILWTLPGLQAPHNTKTVAKLVLKFANDTEQDKKDKKQETRHGRRNQSND